MNIIDIKDHLLTEEVTKEDQTALAESLVQIASEILDNLQNDKDIVAESLQAIEISHLLCKDITVEPVQEQEKLPWAVISNDITELGPFYKPKQINEDLQIVNTFESYDEAVDFANELNYDNTVINVNWDSNEYTVRMVVERE
jgi:hypothetical protein